MLPDSQQMFDSERNRLNALMRVVRWRRFPHIWMHERLGIPMESIDWRMFDPVRYGVHKWDGTKRPLVEAGNLLGQHKNVAIESGTGTGKTFWAAAILLWFLDVFPKTKRNPGGFVITGAPKEDQLRLNLWKEVGRLWPAFQKIRPKAQLMSLRIRMDPSDTARDAWGAIGYPVGVGAEEQVATRAQGFHNPDMLIILEETPGIPFPIIEAFINTSVAPHNLLLALGNPDNEFDSLHQVVTMPDFNAIRMSALDHPNVVLKDSDLIPGAVSSKSIGTRLARLKGDENHPIYLSRVRGICPEMSDSSLFRPEAIRAARAHAGAPLIHTPIYLHHGPGGTENIYRETSKEYRNRYLVFADVAGDRGDGDWHAAIALDRMDRGIAGVLRMRGPRDEYVKYLLRFAERFSVRYSPDKPLKIDDRGRIVPFRPNDPDVRINWPVLAWEVTGVGALHLVPEFRDYPNLYYRRSTDNDSGGARSTLGWSTTEKTRNSMMAELAEWGLEVIANPKLMPDLNVIQEAVTLVWVVKNKSTGSGRYEAKSGQNDDLMMALGGALVVDKMVPPIIKIPTLEGDIERQKQFLLDTWRDKRNSKVPQGQNYFGSHLVDTRGMPLTP